METFLKWLGVWLMGTSMVHVLDDLAAVALAVAMQSARLLQIPALIFRPRRRAFRRKGANSLCFSKACVGVDRFVQAAVVKFPRAVQWLECFSESFFQHESTGLQ